jgi:hypothetical protein
MLRDNRIGLAALIGMCVCQPLRARNVSEGLRPNRRAYSAANHH